MIDPLEFGTTHTFIDGNCHELAHQWFGDYVACASFEDIWLSEGFAMLGAYLGIFNWQLTYCKGFMLLHMIRYELDDDELFFTVLKNYIDEYANGIAYLEDFKSVLEETTGKNFTQFFDQWYYGEGYPVLDISWEQNNGILDISSIQSTSCDTTPLFQFNMDYKLVFEDGDSLICLSHDEHNTAYSIPMDKTVLNIIPDPDKWMLVKTNIGFVGTNIITQEFNISLFPNPCEDQFWIKYETAAVLQIQADQS